VQAIACNNNNNYYHCLNEKRTFNRVLFYGFIGNGISFTQAAAEIIKDEITGKKNERRDYIFI